MSEAAADVLESEAGPGPAAAETKLTIGLATLEQIDPVFKVKLPDRTFHYHTPNRACLWRAKTLFTKEPGTIAWLDAIEPGATLVDIGANVGMYTIYAAARGVNVVAFEPESQNFALLNKNIFSNKLSSRVRAYCVALSDAIGLSQLYLSKFSLGGSCHSLGEEVGFDLKPRPSPFAQGSMGLTLDALVENGWVPVPDYIKIDVDGFEHKVILGALRTLKNERVRSIIVELNPHLAEHQAIIKFLDNLGFAHDPEQVLSAARREGAFAGVGEWVFFRPQPVSTPAGMPRIHYTSLPSVLPDEIDQPLLDHILGRIEQAEVVESPFPHAVVDDVFPAEYYAELLRLFPNPEQMVPLAETARVSARAYAERRAVLFDPGHFARLDEERRACWGRFGAWLYSERFINEVLEKFRNAAAKRLWEVERRYGRVHVRGDALIVDDRTDYAIGPHTDAAHRLITFLFYLPADDSQRKFGTSIYLPKDSGFQCQGGPHYRFEDFDRVKTVDFLPNRLLMFVRNNLSFHGVERIVDPGIERHLVINNIRLVDV